MTAVRKGSGLVELAACKRLFRLAAQVPRDEVIVELGAHRGRSTGWLAAGAISGCGAHVYSVDPWETIASDAVTDEYAAAEPAYRNGRYASARDTYDAHLDVCGVTHQVTPIQTTGLDLAARWSGLSVGLLFHDAIHSYDAVRADLEAWAPHLARRCVVALHDLGNPAFGVEAAAAEALPPVGFDWPSRHRMLWRKDPERRGLLVVGR